jgi:hypothetical protein
MKSLYVQKLLSWNLPGRHKYKVFLFLTKITYGVKTTFRDEAWTFFCQLYCETVSPASSNEIRM